MDGTFEEEKEDDDDDDDDDDEVCETQSCEKKGIAHMRARNTDQINHTRRGGGVQGGVLEEWRKNRTTTTTRMSHNTCAQRKGMAAR